MRFLPPFLGAVLVMLLGQCAGPPPAPGDSAYRGKQAVAYRLGYHHGFMDGSGRRDDNFERYHDEYEPEQRDLFARGYQAGYDAGRNSAAADAADRDRAYQNGYDAGQADGVNGARPDYRRYLAQFAGASEASFREGYEKGWEDARRQ